MDADERADIEQYTLAMEESARELRAEVERLRAVERRYKWMERMIADSNRGLELYPIGPLCEYDSDGNTVIEEYDWRLPGVDGAYETLDAAIDAALAAKGER